MKSWEKVEKIALSMKSCESPKGLYSKKKEKKRGVPWNRKEKGLKDYVKIVTKEKRIITLTNIKGMLEKLPQDRFIRVHKSYIVAKDKVQTIKGTVLTVADKEIPVGLTFKDNFKKEMNLKE